MKKNNRKAARKALHTGILVAGELIFFTILYYVIFIAKGYYHSDCTDTIMWAQASYDAKAFVNPDFCYAGILPFGGQLLMLPFVAIFGVGLKAQIIGMVLFTLLFVAAIVLLGSCMDWGRSWTIGLLTAILLLVSSSEKLREIFWGHIIYYSLGVFFLIVGFVLVLKCLKSEKPLYAPCFWGLFLWTVLCAMDGAQILMLCAIPLTGALVAERFFNLKTALTDKRNRRNFEIVLILVVGMLLGLLLRMLVVGDTQAGYAEAYSGFASSEDWMNNLLKFFPGFFSLMGVRVESDTLLYSWEGICNLVRIICAMLLICVPIVMTFFYKKFEKRAYRLMFWIHHIMTVVILLGWIFGKLSSAEWRLSPVVVTSTILCVMFLRWIYEKGEWRRIAFVTALPIVWVMCMTLGELLTMPEQSEDNAALAEAAEYLEDNHLEYGYGTFWNANIITLLSDSKVKVRCIELGDTGYEKNPYQTNLNWYEDAEKYSRYFVLLTNGEYIQYFEENDNYEQPEEILSCQGYKILVYADKKRL